MRISISRRRLCAFSSSFSGRRSCGVGWTGRRWRVGHRRLDRVRRPIFRRVVRVVWDVWDGVPTLGWSGAGVAPLHGDRGLRGVAIHHEAVDARREGCLEQVVVIRSPEGRVVFTLGNLVGLDQPGVVAADLFRLDAQVCCVAADAVTRDLDVELPRIAATQHDGVVNLVDGAGIGVFAVDDVRPDDGRGNLGVIREVLTDDAVCHGT